MGGVLRVEPASMHYKARLAKDDKDELSRKQPLEQDHANVRLQPGDDRPHECNTEDAAPLTILRRDGKKVAIILLRHLSVATADILCTGCSCKTCLGMTDT